MDIGLREWLIIGGILVIVLILIDGWRRIRSGRTRIRMDIDRRRAAEQAEETTEVSPLNPELPNGGVRRPAKAGGGERHEPHFAPEKPAPVKAAAKTAKAKSAIPPATASPENPPAKASQPVSAENTSASLSEMDPLFDDIPLDTESGVRAERQSAQTASVDPVPEPEPQVVRQEPLWDDLPEIGDEGVGHVRKVAAEKPQDEDLEETSPASSSTPKEEAPDDDFDPEKPIPVLFNRIDDDDAPPLATAPQNEIEEPEVELPRQQPSYAEQAPVEHIVEQTEDETLRSEEHSVPPEHDRWDDEPAYMPPTPEKKERGGWLAGLARTLRGESSEPSQPIERPETADDFELPDEPESRTEPTLDIGDETEPEDVSHSFDEGGRAAKTLANVSPDDLLVIFVVTDKSEPMSGVVIHRIAEACGMEFGDLSLYHRYEGEEGEGALQFSMANAVNPGTFDMDNIGEVSTPAVTLFMSISEPTDPMYAYECMLATAETLAKHAGGELLDGDRSVMRPQTKEHYRERIRNVEIHRRVQRAR